MAGIGEASVKIRADMAEFDRDLARLAGLFRDLADVIDRYVLDKLDAKTQEGDQQ